MKRTAVIVIPSDTEEDEEEDEDEEEEDESEEERRQDEVKSKLILDSLNPDLRERALRMLRQIEAGTLDRRPDSGNEIDSMSDDIRIDPWNQVEVFAPVVAAAWHSKAARKSATAWQCIPVIPYAYERVERHPRQSKSHRQGSNVRERKSQSLRPSGQPNFDEAPIRSVPERSGRSSRSDLSRVSPQQRRTQRSGVTRERNVGDASQLFVSKDHTGGLEERSPRKKIKSNEQALREAREILKKREEDRRKAAEEDALEATLFRANAPPPKLFAAPSKLREQGLEEIARSERGRVDRTFDPALTNPIDRHQRTINRTNTVSNWDYGRKVPTWEERMDYLRRQSPPRGSGPTLDFGDNGFDIGRANTPTIDPYRGQQNQRVRIQESSPFSTSNSRPQSGGRRFPRDSEEQGSGGSRHVDTLAERQQPHSLPQSQPRHSTGPAPPAPPTPRPNPLPRGASGFGGIRPAEAPISRVPASAPRTDWRNSEWMAQYQAQAEDDPLAKFYGK